LHDEWKFRLTFYWKISIKFYFAILILTLFPLIHGIWDVDLIYFGVPLCIFPILGLAASVVVTKVALAEIKTIKDIDTQICTLVKITLNKEKPTNGWYKAYPLILFAVQLFISIAVYFFVMRI